MRTSRIAVLVGAAAALFAAGAAEAQSPSGFGRKFRTQEKEKPYIPPSRPTEKVFPLDATWTAVSLNGKSFSGERPSFSIDKQYRARGFGGCNSFAATAFPLREQSLAVGPLAMTKRSCDKGLAALEQTFLVALRTAGKWDFVGSTLVIKSQAGELRLERAL
jgi:heat shock protein HslJ